MKSDYQDDLPDTWTLATIGELLGPDGVFTDGDWIETKDQDPDGDVRLIQLADIGDGEFIDKSNRFLTDAKAQELKCTFLRQGDVLVARMPDPLGRACIFPLDGDKRFVTAVDVCVIRPDSEFVDSKFLMYALNSPSARVKIDSYKSGSTRKRISRKNLAKVQIPVAPLQEQRRVVAKTDELLSELDKGIESLQAAREQLKVYRQTILKCAFEGLFTAHWRNQNKEKLASERQLVDRLQEEALILYEQQVERWQTDIAQWESEGKSGRKPSKPRKPRPISTIEDEDDIQLPVLPEGWAWFRLGDFAEVSGGLTKNQKRKTLPRKMKYLRVANVYADDVLTDEVYEIGVTDAEARKVALEADDLLVVEGNGSISQIGRVGMWEGQIPECGHQNHLIRVRLGPNSNPRFLLQYLLSPIGRNHIVRVASSTSGLYTLSLAKVSDLPVPIPSPDEAEEIVSRLDSKLSIIDKTLEEIQSQLEKADALRQSVLKRAFAGELVPQNPSDKPASVILEAIKLERRGDNNTSKKRKTA